MRAMKSVLPLSVVALAAALAGLTWYVALMPLWLTQSGERTSSGGDAYYAQGVGIWLNYTEHVGDATFDPGNSLWVPIQPTGADSFASQCSVGRPFCSNAVGELHKQYCQVMQVYCGAAMAFLQVAMSALSGLSILTIVWAVRVVTTAHRTAADRYLMHLCVLVGVSYLVIVVVWYIGVFRVILDTTFYKDQFSRCSENSTGRKCWSVGLCVYLSIAGAVLYPLLSVLAVTHITNKFRRFQRLLRKLFESVTLVELPPAAMALKTESVNADAAKAGEVAIQVDKRLGALSPTGRHPPSTLRSASDLRLDVDNAADEIDDDDHASDSHGQPSSKMTAV